MLSVPTIPEIKIRLPTFSAMGYGPMGGDNSGEVTSCLVDVIPPYPTESVQV